ncbi:MAG: ribonuclease HI [Deltaproteobacteria bacterium]|nr:ribonuclease HI [Deltaproteobacteria bacterium]
MAHKKETLDKGTDDGTLEKVAFFTDGSCLGNPGPGGWACLLVVDRKGKRHEKLLVGGDKQSTNNRMEMQAILEGFKSLKKPCRVHVVTDSKYVIDGITKWVHGWIKRGWKTSANKPVKNQEIWQELLKEEARHQVEYEWVKGHSGHEENERVDEAARLFAEGL